MLDNRFLVIYGNLSYVTRGASLFLRSPGEPAKVLLSFSWPSWTLKRDINLRVRRNWAFVLWNKQHWKDPLKNSFHRPCND